jgi:ankyrin repeat protein
MIVKFSIFKNVSKWKRTMMKNTIKNDLYALNEAICNGDLELAIDLIKKNADINLNPLANIKIKYSLLKYAMDFLKGNNCIKIMKILIKNGEKINPDNCNSWIPIHHAIKLNDLRLVVFLVVHGANINQIDTHGWNPIHVAISNKNIRIVRFLIENGANINLCDNVGWTPLHSALSLNHRVLVEVLIEYNANVNISDNFGNTPLHRLVKVYNNVFANHSVANILMIKLIKHGADVNKKNNDDETPLQCALSTDIVMPMKILLAAGANYIRLPIILHTKIIECRAEFYSKRINFQKKNIELVGFHAIRERAGTICIALQDLDLPAPQTIEIIVQACVPFAENLPYHYLWDLVVMVKHFHDRQSKKMSEKEMMFKQ